MKTDIKYLALFFVLSCKIIEPVNRQIKISKTETSADTISLINFETYYISNSFYNNGNPYFNLFKFNRDGSIKKFLSFSDPDSIVKTIKEYKDSFIVDRYQKDWRYLIQDSSITLEYIFRTPGRTLRYFYGKIDESGKIMIDSSYIKLKDENKLPSFEFKYLLPIK